MPRAENREKIFRSVPLARAFHVLQRRARQGAPPCASEQFQDPVAVVGTGRAVRLSGDDDRAGVERRLKPVGRSRAADVPQQHDLRTQDALGVCVLAHAALDHARGRAVDGLEHGVAVADVGAARRADAALKLRGLIGDDVAVEVRQQQHLKAAAHALVDEVRRHDVDIVVIDGDLRIVGGHLVADGGELAVRLFEDVCLRDDGHAPADLRRDPRLLSPANRG